MQPTKQTTDQHITIELTKEEASIVRHYLQPIITQLHMNDMAPRTPRQRRKDALVLERLIEIIMTFQQTKPAKEEQP